MDNYDTTMTVNEVDNEFSVNEEYKEEESGKNIEIEVA